MEIIPAIDLKDAKAVRLFKGEMNSAKIYSNSPWDLASEFEQMGAQRLHVVDLDGAIKGETINFNVVEKIIANTKLKIEIGGGIRDEKRIKDYLNLGVDRVILGSIALKNPQFVKYVAKKYKIVVGIDAKDGYVAVEGWENVSSVKATELAKIYADAGVEAIIATDISKDGTLSGVNIEFTREIAKTANIDVIASGGVANIEDIEKIAQTKDISGVIVGKAYYEGKIDLKKAFKLVR